MAEEKKGTKAYKEAMKEHKAGTYQVGGQVPSQGQQPNFPMENPAIADANKMGQELKSISLENIPTENAPDRMETSPVGDEVGTGMYKEGGKV